MRDIAFYREFYSKTQAISNSTLLGTLLHKVTDRIYLICIFNPKSNAWLYYTVSRALTQCKIEQCDSISVSEGIHLPHLVQVIWVGNPQL